MSFVRKDADPNPIVDTVFAVAMRAKQDKAENGDLVVDATIGSMFDEDGQFVAFHSVFDHYDSIDHRVKGACVQFSRQSRILPRCIQLGDTGCGSFPRPFRDCLARRKRRNCVRVHIIPG